MDDSIFYRMQTKKTNFVSIYYLEYGDSKSELRDVSADIARREKVYRAGFGNMSLLSKRIPKVCISVLRSYCSTRNFK